MNNWNGKHPIPWDYFNSMNTGSGKNLNWFFNNWFYTNNYIDLKVSSASQMNDLLTVNVDNVGGFAIPFDAEIGYEDGTVENFIFRHRSGKRSEKTMLTVPITKKVKSVNLDGGIFMDYTERQY
jgi:hypothetical protein